MDAETVETKRQLFINVFQSHGFVQGTELYTRLYEFLTDPVNSIYLQSYFVMSSGLLDDKDLSSRISDLAAELRFVLDGGYSYRKLYSLDHCWYEFFRENTYPCGGRRDTTDYRRGVDKDKVDRIMTIRHGPPYVSLDTAILQDCLTQEGLL